MARSRRPQDLQALHRRRVPALGVGPLLRRRRRQGEVPGQRRPGLPQGRPRRRASPPARRSAAGRAGRRTTAARSSTGSPRSSRTGASSSSRRVPPAEGVTAAPGRRRRVDAAIDRLVWYAGWADKIAQVVGNANPVAGPYFNLSTPEPTGVVAVLAPQESSLLGLVSVVAPGHRHRQHRSWCSSLRRGRCRRSPSPRCWRPPTCPAAWSTCSPARRRPPRPWLAAHMDVNAIDLDRCSPATPSWRRALEVAAADNLKRVAAPRPPSPTGPPTPASTG